MTKKELENRLEDNLNRKLIGEEFENKGELNFRFQNSDLTAEISFNVKGYSEDDLSGQSIYAIKLPSIDNLWINHRNQLNSSHQPVPSFMTFTDSYFNSKMDTGLHSALGSSRVSLKNEIEVENFEKQIIYNVKNLFLPFIEKAKDLSWLDAQLNTDPLNFKLSPPFQPEGLLYKKLIVAKLAENPKFEEIYQQFRAVLTNHIESTNDQNSKNQLEVLTKVHQELT